MEAAPTTTRRPQLPPNFFKFQTPARLKAVQQFISSYEYKQSPLTSFNSHKVRPLARIMDTAKLMVYEPQPIKCVEAVFLALYLTAGMHEVDRIPLSFKTEEDSKVHQHIVLLVRYGNKYGAFGISRRPELMNKEFEFSSMSEVIENYVNAYKSYLHTVLKIRIGLPVEHNVDSYNFICWRYLNIMPQDMPWNECCEEMEKHALQAKRLWEKWLAEGQGGVLKSTATFRSYTKSVLRREEEAKMQVIQAKQKAIIAKEAKKLLTVTKESCTLHIDGSSQQTKKRQRRVTVAAARLKHSSGMEVVALKGRTIELGSGKEREVTRKDQFSGSLLRRSRNRPGNRKRVCPLVPCRVAIPSFC